MELGARARMQRVPSGSPRRPFGKRLGSAGLRRGTVWQREPGVAPADAALGACLSPPLQKHLSLMKRSPLRGHLARTATRPLLSDNGSGWPGQPAGGSSWPTVQPGLRTPQLHPLRLLGTEPRCQEGAGGMKQDSRLEKEKGKDSRRRGEGLPFRVGTPAPLPLPH